MTGSADLPDLNVWLALATPDHAYHQQALIYWEQQAAEQVLFCTVTALGLVRLVSQPKVMGSAVRNAQAASALLKAFCQQAGVRMATPASDGWDVFSTSSWGRRTSRPSLHRHLPRSVGDQQRLATCEL